MEKIKKIMRIAVGLQISGLGTAILFRLGFGSAPGATITEGVAEFFGLNYTFSGLAVNLFFLVLLLLTYREIVGIGTVMATFLFGVFIDTGTFLIRGIPLESYALGIRLVFLLIGSILAAAGLGYYIGEDAGVGALDAPAIIGERKYGLDFKKCRWAQDALMMVLGVLMGASRGVGTVVATVVNAPVMDFVLRRKRR